MKMNSKIKKRFLIITAVFSMLALGCGSGVRVNSENSKLGNAEEKAASVSVQNSQATVSDPEKNEEGKFDMKNVKVKITIGNKAIIARLEDNVTARAFVEKLPVTLDMSNLYGREMCYRYGNGGLPIERTRADSYAVGDIVYWPPRGSFVILYKQTGENFERQQIGHIDSGTEIFNELGDAKVTFELST